MHSPRTVVALIMPLVPGTHLQYEFYLDIRRFYPEVNSVYS